MRWVYQFSFFFQSSPVLLQTYSLGLNLWEYRKCKHLFFFFFYIWDRQSERLSSLRSVPGYLRAVSSSHIFENGPPCQLTWVTVVDITWPQSRALRSWSSSQFTWKPFCYAFNKVLSPCLWLSGKLPFNSGKKKYPSKPIQFFKLQPFKFIGPY